MNTHPDDLVGTRKPAFVYLAYASGEFAGCRRSPDGGGCMHYFCHKDDRNCWKVGYTTQSLATRMSQLAHDEGFISLEPLHWICCNANDAPIIERRIHGLLADLRVRGKEWYTPDGNALGRILSAFNSVAA